MDRSLILSSLLAALLVCAGASASFAQQDPDAPPAEQTQPADDEDEPDAEQPADDEEQPADDEEQAEDAEDQPDQPADGPAEEGDQAADDGDAAAEDAEGAEGAGEEPPAEDDDQAAEEPDQDEPVEEPDQAAPAVEEPIEEPEAEPEFESPISDLAGDGDDDDDFMPLEDLEEGVLERITPAALYPYVEWSGYFRLRTKGRMNFDLDTQGTSAVPSPAESFVAPTEDQDTVADDEADSTWTTDIRLRVAPTIHIDETLRVHVEADILDNIVLGTQRNDPDFIGVVTDPDGPGSLIRINEGWGELETFFGTFRAGRTDDHFGLGIFANDGDCPDCDVEAPIDRVSYTGRFWDTYARLSVDFPATGRTTEPLTFGARPYDVGQIDDASQYTVALFRQPRTREEREVRSHRLRVDKKPVFNGGVYLTYRSQDGFLSTPQRAAGETPSELDALDQGVLVYRGMQMYIPDLWFEMLYNPEPDLLVRVAVEAVGVFGSIDNATREPVGTTEDGDTVNCFDEQQRDTFPQACTNAGTGPDREDVSRDVAEFGAALESELYFGGPFRFGLNGGFATGGPRPNWGYDTSTDGNVSSPDTAGLDFYRFSPNYHVDLILFREVMGTVTNAYYANPWGQVRFLETADSRMEVQLDAIFSAAFDPDGTPSAVIDDDQITDGNRLLGLEFDSALRYLEMETFAASLEAGILFPFSGLDAQLDGRRLVQLGDQPERYGQDIDASVAWTVQGNLTWSF